MLKKLFVPIASGYEVYSDKDLVIRVNDHQNPLTISFFQDLGFINLTGLTLNCTAR